MNRYAAAGISIIAGNHFLLLNNQFPDFSSSWTSDILTVFGRKSMKFSETIPYPNEPEVYPGFLFTESAVEVLPEY